MTLADVSPLANHLWQSTLFVLVVWLLTLVLRNNRAQVRYWLWLVASVKFLVPFSTLVAIGRQFEWQSSTDIVRPEVTFVFDAIAQPFSQPELMTVSSPVTSFVSFTAVLPILLLGVWLMGCAMHLLAWRIRWRRLRVIVRDALPLTRGREADILHRLEGIVGLRRSVTLASSDSSIEPGVFGIVKPVLLWPRGISQRLSDHQVQALLTHELCHVRRRDNLAAALHMIVEAVFWFHPLVWWLENRLVDERERACDEAVIRLGSDPQWYAESILRTCEFYAESPLVCVSGVTGSDLKKRVEAIMSGHDAERLNTWKKLVLATVSVLTLAGPVVNSALNTPRLRAQSSTTAVVGPPFEVASIKPNNSGDPGMRMVVAQSPPGDAGGPAFEVASVKPNKSSDGPKGLRPIGPGGRFIATRLTLRELIRLAYGSPTVLMAEQVVSGPRWLDSDHFDIVANIAERDLTPGPNGFSRRPFMMLRTLLQDRFKVRMHTETRQVPIYALVGASDRRSNRQLRQSTPDCIDPFAAQSSGPVDRSRFCGFRRVGSGVLAGQGVTMELLAGVLAQFPDVGRIVHDQTGLTGGFDIDLNFTPGVLAAANSDASPVANPTTDIGGPSIFTALHEQLGLKLESRRGPVDVLVIDSAEQPTAD